MMSVVFAKKPRQCTLVWHAFFPAKHRTNGLIQSQQLCITTSFGSQKYTHQKRLNILEVVCSSAGTRLVKFQLSQFLPKPAMLHELLNIAQTAPGRYQFIAELEREITHPLGVLTHTRKLLIYQGILYICGNQLHKLG